jgi:hypothetical protein
MQDETKQQTNAVASSVNRPAEVMTTLNIDGKDYTATTGLAEAYRARSISGANWFLIIAALSIVNSIIILADGRWSFLAGLGMTQIIDGLAIGVAGEMGRTATIIALLMDAMVAGVFVLLGMFARKQQSWAFIAGMCIYALDGLIFLFVHDWFALAFHAYALYSIYGGFAANQKFHAAEAEAAAARG